MRVEFRNSFGGKMFVDESRVEEYKRAGYIPACDMQDGEVAPVQQRKTATKRGTVKKKEG